MTTKTDSLFTDNTRVVVPSNTVSYSRSCSRSPLSLDPITYLLHPHTPNNEKLYIFISGECQSIGRDYTHTLQPGDVSFFDSTSYNYNKILSNATYERIVINFRANERLKLLLAKTFDNATRIVNLDLQRDVVPFYKRYEEYAKRLPIADFSILAENMVEELVYLCLMQKLSSTDALDPAETLFRQAFSYIDDKWETIQNIQEISDALFISPSYLYEIFGKKMQLTPKAYLTQKRMQAAHALLASGVSPGEVSRSVGFTTYTAFYRSFKSFYGKKPQDVWNRNPSNK